MKNASLFRVQANEGFISVPEKEGLICSAFFLLNDTALRAVHEGADDHDLAVCILDCYIVEAFSSLLVCTIGTLLSEISVEALFEVTEKEL